MAAAAHHVLPEHRPHDQLRTEPAKQRPHTDKYVSCFETGTSSVDLTFRNPILGKSADHFKVGIDELTANIGALSMLEYENGEILFRIERRGVDGEVDAVMPDGPAGDVEKWRNAFAFTIDRVYNTLQEVFERVSEMSDAVGSYMREEGLVNFGADLWEDYGGGGVLAAGTNHEYFRMGLNTNGNLVFAGARMFWAHFVIQVPLQKYREILYGAANTTELPNGFLSLHPETGLRRDPYINVAGGHRTTKNFEDGWDGDVGPTGHSSLDLEYVAAGNLLNNLDRRVTLEVGCSLPLKNSPLIDHGVEAPDFVIGRYMFHKPYSMSSREDGTVNITSESLGVQTLQGGRDRVVFHHLKPQQKILTLRLKLYARVRSYNDVTGKWGMKTIACPVQATDYWHVRLHFVEK